ncbi:MAG TPA: sigma-70 family RNA polymerase sigma factor [Candidatus Saccharimonadales bacterium]|nr:sigma-70 family RNA polymerase sigma factor [Candidatus Saccharimonadales bacterium]
MEESSPIYYESDDEALEPGSKEEVFEALFTTQEPKLFGYLQRQFPRLQPADIEDIVSETMLKAWRGWEGFEGKSAVSTWLCSIGFNEAIQRYRKSQTKPEVLMPSDELHAPVAGTNPEEAVVTEMTMWTLLGSLAANRSMAQIVLLRHYYGFLHRETAAILDKHPVTVRTLYHEAKKKGKAASQAAFGLE